MKDIETLLKQHRPVAPSGDLDRRINQLLDQAPTPRFHLFTRRVALWQCAAACLLCAFLGYFASREAAPPAPAPEPEPASTIYIIQSGPEIPRRAFDATAHDPIFLGNPDEITTHIYPNDPMGTTVPPDSRPASAPSPST